MTLEVSHLFHSISVQAVFSVFHGVMVFQGVAMPAGRRHEEGGIDH